MTDVTVIVVSYNSQLHLQSCLTSVMEKGEAAEIIVVDNSSSDGSVDLVRSQFPSARLIANSANRGFAAAANQGIASAASPFVLLLNPDVTLLPGAIRLLELFLETHPHAAAVGPRQWLDDTRTWQWAVVPHPPTWRSLMVQRTGLQWLGIGNRWLAAHWDLNRSIWRCEEPQPVPYLSGGCLLLRRAALKAVGGIDEDYFLFFEDVDLCERLRAAGWSLHAVPVAGVIHTGLGSVSQLPDRGQHHLWASGQRYLTRHGDPLTRTLWALRRLRHRSLPTAPGHHPPAATLHWLARPGTSGYLVEMASDRTFLYVAAAQIGAAECAVPQPVQALIGANPLYWRVSPVDSQGELGPTIAAGTGLEGTWRS